MKTVGNLYVKIAREVLAHKFSDLDVLSVFADRLHGQSVAWG